MQTIQLQIIAEGNQLLHNIPVADEPNVLLQQEANIQQQGAGLDVFQDNSLRIEEVFELL